MDWRGSARLANLDKREFGIFLVVDWLARRDVGGDLGRYLALAPLVLTLDRLLKQKRARMSRD